MKKVEIVGLDPGNISLNFQKVPIKTASDNFNQVLNRIENEIWMKRDLGSSWQKNSDTKSEGNLVQENNDQPPLDSGDDLLNHLRSGSDRDILQLLQECLDLNSQNPSEISLNAGQQPNEKANSPNSANKLDVMIGNISSIISEELSTISNDAVLPLLKFAVSNNFPANPNASRQTLAGILKSAILNRLEEIGQNTNTDHGVKDLGNSFSQTQIPSVSNTNTISKSDNLKSMSSLIDWNSNSSNLNQNSTLGSKINFQLESGKIESSETLKRNSSNTKKNIDSAIEMQLLPFINNSNNIQVMNGNNSHSTLNAVKEILPQEEPSLNPDIMQSIQNVFGLSEQKASGSSAGSGAATDVKTDMVNLLKNVGRELRGKETMMASQTGQTSQNLSQPDEVLNLLNETGLNELFSQLQTGNDILPQGKISLNSVILQAIQNVLLLSGQKVTAPAAQPEDKVNVNNITESSSGTGTVGYESHGKVAMMANQIGQPFSQQFSQPKEYNSPIKAFSLNDPLFNDNRMTNKQNVEGTGEINGSLQVKAQLSNINNNQKYIVNTFSQAVKEVNNNPKADSVVKTGNSNSLLSDWKNNSSFFVHQMPKLEQFVLMTQGTNKAPATVENMIQQFESILSRSQFSKTGGMQKLVIKLHPENLGSLRIELIQKDQMTVARILTTTAAAKEALESHLHSLKDAFAAQNVSINKVEIETQLTPSQQERFPAGEQQHHQRNEQNDQQQQQKNNKEDETESSFILSLDAALLNKKV